ncbi:LLM class flavin-dependent oxidoreductase [Nocardia pseudobrasiliensis]|uniref:Luciferase-like monooxygenase n=1 Tax=Nocardia pseudobrasiliensis TaxID=45979 RepID=A0A370HYS2_9NOCA|nr:LLM class flavin-dependent oxidoreductase [Nocardia pseudobrasiliensis]RDI63071.1 luciferase-like monooxygenase [Nocardia pseudobrasiliensis]
MATSHNRKVLFGLGLENGIHQVRDMHRHARGADEAGLDFFSLSDHPTAADRVDAYATLGFVLGATSTISGGVICTNLFSRPAPMLARTIAGLSAHSGDRAILVLGANGSPSEVDPLGIPRLSPGARIRCLEEAIIVVRALTGGGEPVTFDGEFYQVTALMPTPSPTPPIWVGVGGPKGLAVTGRRADGWIPPHAADWRSELVASARPIIEEAAVSAGRQPNDVGTVYLVAGPVTRDPVPPSQTRDAGGRWAGGGVQQWVEELTFAVLEGGATGFNYLVRPGESHDDTSLRRWTDEVVPAVRAAIAER